MSLAWEKPKKKLDLNFNFPVLSNKAVLYPTKKSSFAQKEARHPKPCHIMNKSKLTRVSQNPQAFTTLKHISFSVFSR